MPKPNILWYCTDQQRFDTLGALGNPHVRTPHLDRFISESVTFTHAYCQSPICTPSRSSFMTGMYPSRVHNTRNGNECFPDFPPVISRLIANAGYRCGLVGKFHLQSSGHRTEPRLDDGFEFWKFSHAPRDDWQQGHDYAEWVRDRGGDLDAMRQDEERVPAEFHQTTWATERSLEFLASADDRPWMLCVNIYDPHPPFIPPASYARKFSAESMPGPHFLPSDLDAQAKLANVDFQGAARHPDEFDAKGEQARYYAMIAQIDDQFQRLLDGLEATGQRENTLVVFTSDHGEALGDHGLIQKGCRFYEGLVRVPLILRWPREFASGARFEGLVELLDLTSTLLDVAEVSPPEYLQGKTLRTIAGDPREAAAHREYVRCEYFDALDPHFTGGTGTFATMYRDQQYKLCVYHDHHLGELFDLEADPWEHHNLWDDPRFTDIKLRLLQASFDAHVLTATDVGSRRIAPM